MGYYNPPRGRNLYDPKSSSPFTLSRSKIENFSKCPRCFYLDRRLGIDQPPMPSFSLNDAVDVLMKKEFDILRQSQQKHALAEKYKINAVPFQHPDLGVWRDDERNFLGATTLHKPTNFLVSGIIDDVWADPDGILYIVDYKSTSTMKEISLDDEYKQAYKRQVELYQWIFRRNGFKVSDTAYFVFANARKDVTSFDGKLEFVVNIVSHKGQDGWVEPTLEKIKKCLDSDMIPPRSENCDHCKYRQVSQSAEAKAEKSPQTGKEEKLTKQSLF